MHLYPLSFFDQLENSLAQNNQYLLHQGGSPISLGIFDTFTKSFCIPGSSRGRVITSSPSMTSASLYTSLLKLGNETSRTLIHANSPRVLNALAFSREMKVAKASACLSFQLSASTPSLSPFIKVVTSFKALIMLSHSHLVLHNQENHLFKRRALAGARTLHTTNHSPFYVLLLSPWLVDTHHKVFHCEQLTMHTKTREHDGSSSFSFSHDILRKPKLFHMILCVWTYPTFTSSSTWSEICQIHFLTHFRHAFEGSVPHVGDPRAHCCRLFLLLTEQFLYIFF